MMRYRIILHGTKANIEKSVHQIHTLKTEKSNVYAALLNGGTGILVNKGGSRFTPTGSRIPDTTTAVPEMTAMKNSCFMRYIALLIALCVLFRLPAQDTSLVTQKQIVRDWVAAYNEQNYRKMKKPFITLVKLLPLKKLMKKQFSPFHIRYGPATIDTMLFHSPRRVMVKLNFKYDSLEDGNLAVFFNKKTRIQGIGFGQPSFSYPLLTKTDHHIDLTSKKTLIDTLVRSEYRENRFGGAVLVIEEGEVIYKNALGYCNYEEQSALTDSSVFELASLSKQFTAMAILILTERGLVRPGDSVKKYIPELPYSGITVEHLLTHTSGLPDYISLMKKHWDKTRIAQNADALKMLNLKKPPVYFPAGSRMAYSNTGYMLLSVIIERVSGQSYADFLQSAIFDPLQMHTTFVYNNRRADTLLKPNYAYGYVLDKKTNRYCLPDDLKQYHYVYYLDGITGDGMVNSNIGDLAKWDRALRENKLVSEDNWQKASNAYQLTNKKSAGYGYGFFVEEEKAHENILWHTGGWPGYHTIYLHFKDRDRSVIVLSNNEYGDFMRMADRIVKILRY